MEVGIADEVEELVGAFPAVARPSRRCFSSHTCHIWVTDFFSLEQIY